MSARVRRGMALSWSALFVFSLVLQYMAFAAAPAALASHDVNLFELDGNATDSAAIEPDDDWDSLDHAADTFFVGAASEAPGNDTTYFTTGGSKDENDVSAWKITPTSVPDKNELLDTYAAVYQAGGDTWVYFGADRFDNDGTAQIGFWFFQNNVGTSGSNFTGVHKTGDVLIISEYTNGGSVSKICAYEWNAANDGHNISNTVGCDPATHGSNLNLVAAGAACDTGDGTFEICAVSNGATQTAPWSFTNKDGLHDFGPGQFYEGGINLSDMFGGNPPCFGTFLAETRSSAETDAQLKDFALGSLDTCVPPTIVTTSSKSTVHFGETVTDTATLSGSNGPASGTVKFSICGPSGSAPDCSTGGTQVGSAVAVTTSANGGTATSAAYTPTAAGFYCWRADYTPDAASQYKSGSHTNQTTECFEVVKNTPTISTAANQTVNVGQSISDSATLAGATSDAGGTITFKAYGPGTDCSGSAAFTSSPVAVSGNGTYGPVSFTPATAGIYRWIASYSGDAKNASASGACNDTGETDTVNKVNPSIATQASGTVVVGGKISDTATVSGGHSPTGTVTFVLYGPNDASCATPIFTSADRPLSGGSATSAEFTTTQAGTYRWIATYNGDANNNSVSGACNDANESVVVTKTTPGISTQLVGDGKTGASITVPLGTAVHDTSTLTGVTANAGGTVHYQVFTDAQCQNLMSDAGTANVVNGVAGNSISITFNQAGTYYWQADYSGDANNNSASSACNLETVTVDKNIPTITTTASGSVEVGGKIHDTAHLSGGFSPTGTITFTLYGPNDAACATVIFTSIVAVSGNGDYPSDEFSANSAGTYRWIASYSGDGNNAPVAGGCGDANESVVVGSKAPTVTTNASASVEVGGQIHDTATLAGGFNPTGSITFTLYGPNNANCSGTAIFTSVVAVNGNGDYVSGNFTTTQAGTYRWIANYGGDANNGATANGCNGANESVIVTKKSPTVTTNASASVTVGGKIHDSATLAGGFNPTGTIHFALYGPDDTDCSKTAIFSADITVNGNGVYGSGDYTTTQAGTYRWIANYGGDANNNATSNLCNAANENVVVTKANPDISTQATEGGQVGDKIHDVATVTGGFNPTGTVTFKLYGPSDPNCDGSAIFTDTVALGGDGTATSADYTVTEKGNFHWVASYSGDANNESASGACGDDGETTVINQFNPDITTTLHSGQISGAKISVLFGSTVSDQATLTGASATAGGTVTYTVYTDSSCTTVYADAGSKTVTNGIVPPSDGIVFPDAGTYYWQASYGGDAANAPALSVCTDEVLTVTTPDLDAEKTVSVNGDPFVHSNSANPGDVLTYKITVKNSGDGVALNVPVSDDISDILAHATYNDDCSNSCSFSSNTLSWTIPSIAVGATATLTFSVTLDDTFPEGQTVLPNVVIVTGPGSNCAADSEDPLCDTTTTVAATPDLDVLKLVRTGTDGAFGPTSVANPGDVVQYQITVKNTGDADATNVPVSDDISAILAHADYNNDCSPSCSFASDTLSWTIPTIASGGTVTLTFSVTLHDSFPEGTTHLPNVVVVTGPGSNCAAQSADPDCDTDTTVEAGPALSAEKEVAVNEGEYGHGGTAKPGDTLNYRITITNSGDAPATNVSVSDNIAALLAHGSYNNDCSPSCSFASNTLSWTIASIDANGGTATVTFSVTLSDSFPSGTTDLPNVVVVTGPGSNCGAESEDADCATDNTVTTSSIQIEKDVTAVNNQPPVNDPDLGVPGAQVGNTVTYTLHYHGEGPIDDAVITDVMPAGLEYVAGSATSDAKFTFQGYNAATRTLTWTTDLMVDPQTDGNSVDGSLSYKVLATLAAAEGPQPLINVAKIVGHTPDEEELTDSDTAAVTVLQPPLHVTPPPTSTITPETGTSNPGFALMLILLGVAGLSLGIGFITPVPASVRRRERRR